MSSEATVLGEIIAREFRRVKEIEPDVDIKVEFTEDETIVVTFSCKEYVMEIGSDDDYFWFRDEDTDDYVQFDYPPDWPEASL